MRNIVFVSIRLGLRGRARNRRYASRSDGKEMRDARVGFGFFWGWAIWWLVWLWISKRLSGYCNANNNFLLIIMRMKHLSLVKFKNQPSRFFHNVLLKGSLAKSNVKISRNVSFTHPPEWCWAPLQLLLKWKWPNGQGANGNVYCLAEIPKRSGMDDRRDTRIEQKRWGTWPC